MLNNHIKFVRNVFQFNSSFANTIFVSFFFPKFMLSKNDSQYIVRRTDQQQQPKNVIFIFETRCHSDILLTNSKYI